MKRSRWDRFAFWLETTRLRRWVMRPHSVGPVGPRYINRLNGHVVTGGDDDR